MTNYIERLESELTELTERCEKLSVFINKSDVFAKLSTREQQLLKQQLGSMESYRTTLELRLHIANNPS